MSWRVDNVPLLIRPLFFTISWLLALAFVSFILLLKLSVKIEWVGFEKLSAHKNRIDCIWHHNLFAWFLVFSWKMQGRQVWLNHPLWYMKPTHFMLAMIGVKELVLGSSGNGGLEAAKILESKLKAGASTTVAVDGPAGPALVVKKGAFHMAANCGLILVPLSFQMSRPVLLSKTWDIKRFPLPFSKVVVIAGDPIKLDEFATALTLDDAIQKLAADL